MNQSEDYMSDRIGGLLSWVFGVAMALCIVIPLVDLLGEVLP